MGPGTSYQRVLVVIQMVDVTVTFSSLKQETHQEDILHDNTTFVVLPVQPPRDIICPQHNPSSVPDLLSSTPAFQSHN